MEKGNYMKKTRKYIRFVLLMLFAGMISFSCSKEDEAPMGAVNLNIDLQNVNNIPLKTINGYLYFYADGYYNAGYQGVIVYRYSEDIFLAYELACPKDHDQAVEVDKSGLILVCPKCHSKFIFTDGSVFEGPARVGLRSYSADYDGARWVYVRN